MDRKERIEAMVAWFSENFEDPAQHTPHDSGEGGYQYIWGGPYDALEEIGEAFPHADQDEIEEAVDEVQADGTFEWAPTDTRIQPDDYADDPDNLDDGFELDGGPQEPLENRLEALAGQLDRIRLRNWTRGRISPRSKRASMMFEVNWFPPFRAPRHPARWPIP